MPLRTDGAALRERRTLKGLTIVEFAQLIDYNPDYVSEVELGRQNAGPHLLRKAAKILDCEIDDITNGVIPRKRSVTTPADSDTTPERAVA